MTKAGVLVEGLAAKRATAAAATTTTTTTTTTTVPPQHHPLKWRTLLGYRVAKVEVERRRLGLRRHAGAGRDHRAAAVAAHRRCPRRHRRDVGGPATPAGEGDLSSSSSSSSCRHRQRQRRRRPRTAVRAAFPGRLSSSSSSPSPSPPPPLLSDGNNPVGGTGTADEGRFRLVGAAAARQGRAAAGRDARAVCGSAGTTSGRGPRRRRGGSYWFQLDELLDNQYALLPSSIIPVFDESTGTYFVSELEDKAGGRSNWSPKRFGGAKGNKSNNGQKRGNARRGSSARDDPYFGSLGSKGVQREVELTTNDYVRFAAAGAVCTALIRTALSPLELIKTQLQLAPPLGGAARR